VLRRRAATPGQAAHGVSDAELQRREDAERILLQSVAASTMSAHLAAALGYAVWWITAVGQKDIQKQVKPLLGIPDPLAVIDVMCFGRR
jgi:5,6-dimethylbenzimidazole synthase